MRMTRRKIQTLMSTNYSASDYYPAMRPNKPLKRMVGRRRPPTA
jgi:hypothetical protein